MRGAPSGKRTDDLENRGDARPIERQLGEPLVDVVREADLRQLDLGPPLQLAALEDARHLGRDSAEKVDVTGVELAALRALDVEHPDQARTRLDRHRRHGVESVLVQSRHPLPVRLPADLGHHRRPARVGHPAGDPGQNGSNGANGDFFIIFS